MYLRDSFRWIAATWIGTGSILGLLRSSPAIAQSFEQAEVTDPSQIILVAAPAGQVGYQLAIYEQLTDERPCWEESSGTVIPLLLEFDFTGICRRTLDSNGYSLRMGQEDLGLDYTLRVVPKGSYLALVASPTNDFFAPSIEVGRTTPGQTSGFMAIYLAPGWRLTRRAFEGQSLGHYYITNDMDVDSYMAIAVLSGDVLVAPSGYTFPETPSPAPIAPPALPSAPAPSPLPGELVPTLPTESNLSPPPALDALPDSSPPAAPAPAPQPDIAAPALPSPLPSLESTPPAVPPLTTPPATETVEPLRVPVPPPVFEEESPDESAASGEESSPWIQFNRQPPAVQTF